MYSFLNSGLLWFISIHVFHTKPKRSLDLVFFYDRNFFLFVFVHVQSDVKIFQGQLTLLLHYINASRGEITFEIG